jgi:hypothetical protein
MLRSVTLVRTDVSEELSASNIRMARIGELGRTNSVLTRATRRNIPEDAILFLFVMGTLGNYFYVNASACVLIMLSE